MINNLRGGHCFRSSRTRRITGEKSLRLNWATQFLTVPYDGACSPNVSIRMPWISFGALPCRKKKKTWWQLASPCCWNHARRLTCFLPFSVTRKDLQFGTWTDPSFQRHYRFRPTTSGSRSGLSAPPRTKSLQVHGKHTHRSKTNDSRKRNKTMQLRNYDENNCSLTDKYLLCWTRKRVGKRPQNIYFI